MNIRKLQPKKSLEEGEEEIKKVEEKPKRTRIKPKQEKEKSPLSGALALMVLIGIGLLFVFSSATNTDPQVRGVKTAKDQYLDQEASQAATALRGRFEDRLESIKNQVGNLSTEDAVENSPQIEKIIRDLQSLQGLPQKQAKQVCQSICDAID